MNNCPNCGANVNSGEDFCRVCGTKITVSQNNFNNTQQNQQMNYQFNNQNNINSNNLSNDYNMQNRVNNDVVKQKTNKNAILSIVFSIVSMFTFWWLSLVGISTGVVALREIKTQNEKGKVLAIIGIIIGAIGEILYWYSEIIAK